jgi:hypothetical protein
MACPFAFDRNPAAPARNIQAGVKGDKIIGSRECRAAMHKH